MEFNIFEVQKVADVYLKDWQNQMVSTDDILVNDEENPLLKRIRINTNIRFLDKIIFQKKIMELVEKYESLLADSIIEVFIRSQCSGTYYQKIIYTRILIITLKDRFDVTAEHRNIKLSFYKALIRLEDQLSKKIISKEYIPEKYKYKFGDNSSNRGFSHKIIIRKVHKNGVTIGN